MGKPEKPIGRKNYGSIGHLPNSRLGPGDHAITEGQYKICCVKARDRHERIIVTEKLDGSNTGVALLNGTLYPLQRKGYSCINSPYEMHRLFYNWVMAQQERFLSVLREGERLVGEWLAQAHGTKYNLPHEPWVVFDLMIDDKRTPWDGFLERVKVGNFITPKLLQDNGAIPTEKAYDLAKESGHGAIDDVEGIVYRVEHRGEWEFMAKWLRPDKVDGLYLDKEVWNWRP